MTRTQKLIDTIARLNADAGEIGAGMLANIVSEAKAIQEEIQAPMQPSDLELDLMRSVYEQARKVLRFTGIDKPRAEMAWDELDRAIERVKEFDGGTMDALAAPTQAAMQPSEEMVNRFLSWPLPEGFSPDCGISFDGRKDVPEGLTTEQIQEVIDLSSTYDPAPSVPQGIDLHEFAREIYALRPASDDAKAAQRYRWLKEKMHRTVWCGNGYEFGSIYIDDPERTDDLDATIDAAIAASTKK